MTGVKTFSILPAIKESQSGKDHKVADKKADKTADKTDTCEVITGEGINTSEGVVLSSCTLMCRVCGGSELFEWPEKDIKAEDVEGIDTLALIIAVAHSKNWIAQRVINDHEGKRSLFVLCPTCLALFFSATTTPAGKDEKEKS